VATPVSAGLSAKEGRKFGLTVGIAFIIVAGVLWWREHPMGMAITFALGATLSSLGLLIPRRLGPVQRAWLRLAHLLSRITTPIVMGVLYLFLFTTFGIVMRLFGHNAIVNKASGGSYWVERPRSRGKPGLQRQY
jgi:hypothetical protein